MHTDAYLAPGCRHRPMLGQAGAIGASIALIVSMLAHSPARGADPAGRPNVILIMADDLGYETLGCNGGTSYKTPRLDQLAATGMRFEHCYVQPLCTPTRVQLMSGIYNIRNYSRFGYLEPDVTTFANILQKAGYATGIVGKWQLSHGFEGPKTFGFDDYCLWQLTRRPPRYANPGLEINGKEFDYQKGEYGPDVVNDHAIDFIGRHKDKPFLLYYPMMLTHSPYQPTPDSKGWDPKAMGEQVNQKKEHFGDMVEYMDKLIGKLVDALDKHGLRGKTLVLFVGDNGTGKGTASQMGGRTVLGGKGSTTTFGMHVPLIANWPKTIPAGKVSQDLVDSTDFLPTVCGAAGVTVPANLKIDGRSFLPQLKGEQGTPREWIYCWYSPNQSAINAPKEFAATQKYKLYRGGAFYDYASDPNEMKALDIAKLDPEASAIHKKLQEALDQYKDARPAKFANLRVEKKKKND